MTWITCFVFLGLARITWSALRLIAHWLPTTRSFTSGTSTRSSRIWLKTAQLTNPSFWRYFFSLNSLFHFLKTNFVFQFVKGKLVDFQLDRLGIVAAIENNSSKTIVQINFLPACNHCKRLTAKFDQLKKCSRCKSVLYCSKECQIADWSPHHKAICRPSS